MNPTPSKPDELAETLRAEKLYEQLLPTAKKFGVDIKFVEYIIYDFMTNYLPKDQAARDALDARIDESSRWQAKFLLHGEQAKDGIKDEVKRKLAIRTMHMLYHNAEDRVAELQSQKQEETEV